MRMMGVVDANDRRDELGSERSETEGHRPLLFVVDDDVATLELLCEVGADAGWAAMGFTHLTAVRDSLDRMKPTLLILDDDLPDGRGGDLARDVREDPQMTDVTLLVCTAAHPMRQAEIGQWAPVVAKPFNLVEIEAFLDAAARPGNEPSGRSFDRAG